MNRSGGHAPEPILTADEILRKMREGVKETHEIRLRSMVIPVRVLSVDEMNAIRREAVTVSLTVKGGDETDTNLQKQKSTLVLASNITGAPLLSDKVLGRLSTDEINHLYSEYVNVLDRVNPSLETIPQDEFRMLVEALKKNLASAKDLSLLQLKAICSAFQGLIQKQESQG